jgi:ATP-binding cassette subfamily A (ABC1) protein 3
LTTLEEVFLKLGVESYHDEVDGRHTHSDQVPINVNEIDNYNVQGFGLILYQIEAVLIKKFHILRHMWKQILYIAIFSAWMIFVLMSAPRISFDNITPLKISFESYHDTTTMLESDNQVLTKTFGSLFDGKDKFKEITSGGMSEYILKKSNESLSVVNREFMIGATIKQNSIIAWFNGQQFHTSPLTINTVNRALVKSFIGSDFDISVTNKPYVMPTKGSDNLRDLFEDPKNVIMALVILFFLLTYWPVLFIAPYIKERETRAKLLMFISGMNRYVYWITSLFFDYFVLFIICTVLIAAIGAFQKPHFSTGDELITVLVIAMNYGFGYLPFIYAFSYLFMKHSTGESILTLISLLCE